MKALSASYIKWYMTYEEGRPALEDHFDIKADEREYRKRFATANLAKMMHGLKMGRIDFTLKKSGFLGMKKTNVDTQSLPLTGLGAHSTMTKQI